MVLLSPLTLSSLVPIGNPPGQGERPHFLKRGPSDLPGKIIRIGEMHNRFGQVLVGVRVLSEPTGQSGEEPV